MARIYYSMAGEGRGHAVRARALSERLLAEGHELVLFAPGDAWKLLGAARLEGEVRVEPLPGLRFEYDARSRVNHLATAKSAAGYALRLPRLVEDLAARLSAEQAELCITDFEPALARAARVAGLPLVSVDHQQFLSTADLSILPLGLRAKAQWMRPLVRLVRGRPQRTIVSSFFAPMLRSWRDDALQVGVFLRTRLRDAPPTRGGHLLAYLRRGGATRLLEALRRTGRPTLVYGLGERAPEGALRFRPFSEQGFVDDLAGSDAVVSTAGNQLVGEALWLEKPVLALPEPRNHEQELNAWFLERSGAGRALTPAALETGSLPSLLERLEPMRAACRRMRADGCEQTLRALRPLLGQVESEPAAPLVLESA